MKPFFSFLFFLGSMSPVFSQNPSIKWWYNVKDMAFGQSAAADIDDDGKLELVFSTYRNDSSIHVLNAEDGSVLWSYNTGGCNDVAPLIYDVDQDGDFEIVLPSSCNPTTFCFDADSGFVQWKTPTRGSDSPPTIGDIDNDGKLEILHGEFGGYVICLNAENGSKAWEIAVDVNSWIQTEPIILDVDNNGQLDFIVANWSFGSNHRIWCYRGDNQSILWQDTLPADVMYHGGAFGDMDNDGFAEITLGDYAGNLFCYNAENGSLKWKYNLPLPGYIGAPTSLADLNKDGKLDVVFSDASRMAAVSDAGILIWSYNIPNGAHSFRGAVIGDVNNDNTLDVTFGTSKGQVISLDGITGTLIRSIDLQAHYGSSFEINHAPILSDFDKDGILDVFVVGGHAEYPNIQNNYGRAYAISWGVGKGPEWKMFRRDYRRSACLCNDSLLNNGIGNNYSNPFHAAFFPNPMTDASNLRLTLYDNQPLQIRLYDICGKVIYSKPLGTPGPGLHNFVLTKNNLRNPHPGVYFLEVSSGNKTTTLRIIIHN